MASDHVYESSCVITVLLIGANRGPQAGASLPSQSQCVEKDPLAWKTVCQSSRPLGRCFLVMITTTQPCFLPQSLIAFPKIRLVSVSCRNMTSLLHSPQMTTHIQSRSPCFTGTLRMLSACSPTCAAGIAGQETSRTCWLTCPICFASTYM